MRTHLFESLGVYTRRDDIFFEPTGDPKEEAWLLMRVNRVGIIDADFYAIKNASAVLRVRRIRHIHNGVRGIRFTTQWFGAGEQRLCRSVAKALFDEAAKLINASCGLGG